MASWGVDLGHWNNGLARNGVIRVIMVLARLGFEEDDGWGHSQVGTLHTVERKNCDGASGQNICLRKCKIAWHSSIDRIRQR